MNEIIKLQSGRLEVEVWTLGARLNGVWFDGIGNLVDGSATEEEARGPKKYNGAVVGPVANRIADGEFVLEGRTYVLPRNENGVTTLHSGPEGLHALDWQVHKRSDTSVWLKTVLEDGFGGFPNKRGYAICYSLLGEDKLQVSFDANAFDQKPTLTNLALHPYWCLDCGGRAGLKLSVDADAYLPVDKLQIPTGEIADVQGSMFDLRSLGVPSTEIDHNLCFESDTKPDDVKIKLQGRKVCMDVVTSASGVQIFSGKDIGIAIEPQEWPDAMHHPNFPTIEMKPGEVFRQDSIYHFSRL